MKVVFVFFALLFGTVSKRILLGGNTLMQGHVKARESRQLPRTSPSYARNPDNIIKIVAESAQDLRASKYERKKRAYNQPQKPSNTAGLEKDTDDPDGLFRTLDELKAMRPGPGVQWRDEMPGMGQENDGDLKRKKRSLKPSTKTQIHETNMVPGNNKKDKIEPKIKFIKLNENVKEDKDFTKNSPNAESQSINGQLKLQKENVSSNLITNTLSPQLRHNTRKFRSERATQSSNISRQKHAMSDHNVNASEEGIHTFNTEKDGRKFQHRYKRAADSSDDVKDAAAAPDWWLKRLNYVDDGSRPKDRKNLQETNNTRADTTDSEAEESHAALPQSGQFEYLSPTDTKQLAQHLQQTLQSEQTRESVSDKQHTKATLTENKEDEWLKNELMLIEIESRALKRKAAQLHNKLKRAHLNWKQGNVENTAQNKQSVTEKYLRLHRRVENEAMAPWIRRGHVLHTTEHRTEKIYHNPDDAISDKRADIIDLVSRLENDLSDLKARLMTRSEKENYKFRNTNFDSDVNTGRYKRDVTGSKSRKNHVYLPTSSYIDYRFGHHIKPDRNQIYKCKNHNQCHHLKDKDTYALNVYNNKRVRNAYSKNMYVNMSMPYETVVSSLFGTFKDNVPKSRNKFLRASRDRNDGSISPEILTESSTGKYPSKTSHILKSTVRPWHLTSDTTLTPKYYSTSLTFPNPCEMLGQAENNNTGVHEEMTHSKQFLETLNESPEKNKYIWICYLLSRGQKQPNLTKYNNRVIKSRSNMSNSLFEGHASTQKSITGERNQPWQVSNGRRSEDNQANQLYQSYNNGESINITALKRQTAVERHSVKNKKTLFSFLTKLHNNNHIRFKYALFHNSTTTSPTDYEGQNKRFRFMSSLSRPIHHQHFPKQPLDPKDDNKRNIQEAKSIVLKQYKELLNTEQIRRNSHTAFSDLLRKVIRVVNRWEKSSGYSLLPLLDYHLSVPTDLHSTSVKLRQVFVLPNIKHAWFTNRLLYLLNSRRKRNSGLKPFNRDPVTIEEVSMKEDLEKLLKNFPISESEKKVNAKLRQAESVSTDLGSLIMERNSDDNYPLIGEKLFSSSSRLRRQVQASGDPAEPKESSGDHPRPFSGKHLRRKSAHKIDKTSTSARKRDHNMRAQEQIRRTYIRHKRQIGAGTVLTNKNVHGTLDDTLDVQYDDMINNKKSTFQTIDNNSYLNKQVTNKSAEQVKRTIENTVEGISQMDGVNVFIQAADSSSHINYLFAFNYNQTFPNAFSDRYLKPRTFYNAVMNSASTPFPKDDTISNSHRGLRNKNNTRRTVDIRVKLPRDVSNHHGNQKTYNTYMSDLSKLLNISKSSDINKEIVDSNILKALKGNSSYTNISKDIVSQETGAKQTELVDYFDDNANLDQASQPDSDIGEVVSKYSQPAGAEDEDAGEKRAETETSEGIKLDAKGHKIEPKFEFAFIEKDDAEKAAEYKYSWGEWSECSVTCGIGQRFRANRCGDNQPCTGETASSETEVCSVKDDC